MTFGPGPYWIIRRLRQFQTAYSILSLAVLLLNVLSDNRFYDMYYFLSNRVLGFLILIQFVVLITASIRYAFDKDKDALLFCVGFVAFALITGCELIWFLLHPGYYYMVYWKWDPALRRGPYHYFGPQNRTQSRAGRSIFEGAGAVQPQASTFGEDGDH